MQTDNGQWNICPTDWGCYGIPICHFTAFDLWYIARIRRSATIWLRLAEDAIYMEHKTVKNFRSTCPINCSLELVGDKWTLLIMRDMLLHNKRTFKEFSSSDEGIATNILSNRLAMLEEHGIITKNKMPDNRRVNIYAPTNRGLDLIPIVLELALWCGQHKIHFNREIPDENVAGAISYRQDRDAVIEQIRSQFSE